MTQIEINPAWLYIYGWSDDLIEITGCLNDELDKYKGDVTFHLDDGAIIRIFRAAGWKIEILQRGKHEIEVVTDPLFSGEDVAVRGDAAIIKGAISEIWYKEFIRLEASTRWQQNNP